MRNQRYGSETGRTGEAPERGDLGEGLARGMMGFSLLLGLAELTMSEKLAEWTGLDGKDGLIRIYGMREIATGLAGFAALRPGIAARLAGDAFDIATLVPATARDKPQRTGAIIALAAVLGATLADLWTARELARA